MPAISVLVKPASGLCNMHCDYCFYCDETSKREQASYGLMTEETLKQVIRKTLTRAEGMYSLAFQGGEPTLCGLPFFERAVEYVEQYNRNHVRVQLALQTNGYAITREWAEFFAKHHFLLGVSVDGTAALHNEYRHGNDGGDSFARAMETIRLFEECGVEYNILTVIHKHTAAHIKDIYAAYRKCGWNYMQFITCLDPLGEPRGQKPWSLLPEEYGRFLIDLFDLWYADVRNHDAPYVRQFENYIGILAGYPPESCEQRGTCGIQYVVEADGGVYPCDFYVLDEWRLGNFNSDRVPQIDEMRTKTGFVERSSRHPKECTDCRWHALCRNGCYRSRREAGMEPAGQNDFCAGYRMFFEACYDRMAEITKTVRPGGVL